MTDACPSSMYHVPLQLVTDVRHEVTENGHGSKMNGAGVLGVLFGVVVAIYLNHARGLPQWRLKWRVRWVILTENCIEMVVVRGLTPNASVSVVAMILPLVHCQWAPIMCIRG